MAGNRCIISVFPVRRALVAVSVLAAAVLCALLFLPGGQGGRPEADARLEEASRGLTDYDLVLRLDAEKHTLAISETATFRNGTGDTLDHVVLRTWLNAFQSEDTSPAALEELYDACYPEGFSPGVLTLYDVKWNGEAAAFSYVNDDLTALRVDIPALQNGETGELTLRCVAVLPACAHRTGYTGEDYTLGNATPLLSRYENGAWRTDPYSPIGDPFVSDCANFTVTAYLPEGYVPAASCLLTRDGGAWRGSLKAARDFALCVSPAYVSASGTVNGVRVSSFAPASAGAARALEYARKALETYEGLYGPYPYPTLTVCSARFPFGGMEYPGLCMIGEDNYAPGMEDTLELKIAHETAHQWFYALVGSDQVNDPWQDEALCEYAALRYVYARYGQGSYESLKYYRADAPMRENIGLPLTPGSPISYFGTMQDYATVVYGRGAALLLALDAMLPGGADGFLRAYAEEFAFSFVSREGFQDFLNRWSGMDLEPLLVDYLDTVIN